MITFNFFGYIDFLMGKSLRILIDFSEVTLFILEKVNFGEKAEHCAAEQGLRNQLRLVVAVSNLMFC